AVQRGCWRVGYEYLQNTLEAAVCGGIWPRVRCRCLSIFVYTWKYSQRTQGPQWIDYRADGLSDFPALLQAKRYRVLVCCCRVAVLSRSRPLFHPLGPSGRLGHARLSGGDRDALVVQFFLRQHCGFCRPVDRWLCGEALLPVGGSDRLFLPVAVRIAAQGVVIHRHLLRPPGDRISSDRSFLSDL